MVVTYTALVALLLWTLFLWSFCRWSSSQHDGTPHQILLALMTQREREREGEWVTRVSRLPLNLLSCILPAAPCNLHTCTCTHICTYTDIICTFSCAHCSLQTVRPSLTQMLPVGYLYEWHRTTETQPVKYCIYAYMYTHSHHWYYCSLNLPPG